MFELNPNLKVKKEYVQDYPIYFVDNFYKNPDEVSDHLFNRDVPLWKIGEQPSFNSKHFFDHRLIDGAGGAKFLLKIKNHLENIDFESLL